MVTQPFLVRMHTCNHTHTRIGTMQIRWKADWLCEATGFSSSTSECQALSEGRRACPAQTDGRKAGEKNKSKKQMVKTFPPGGRDGRINGRQTKRRNHGNKSMSTADQREGERGWKQNLVVDLVVTRFYSRESTFYKLFFWAYRVLAEILKTAPLNTFSVMNIKDYSHPHMIFVE